MIIARCRDTQRERITRWLFVTRWGSFHFPPTMPRRSSRTVLDAVRDVTAGHTDEWQAAYFERLRWYARHHGDMTGAPDLPER